jgi:co-chaperonin GroES (HSP10)
MAKQVVDNSGVWLPKADEPKAVSVPKVIGAKPIGMKILVEMLTPQEMMGSTVVHVNKDANIKDPPQGYILAIGPMLEADKYGIKVGDRVLLQGTFVASPSNGQRQQGLIEVHTIHAVLTEDQ